MLAGNAKKKLRSTEVEMFAVSDGLNQVLWLRNFLEDQGYRMPLPNCITGKHVGHQTVPDSEVFVVIAH